MVDLGSCSPTEGSTTHDTEEAIGAESSHSSVSSEEYVNLTVLRSFRDLNSSDLLGVGHVLCRMLGKEDYFGDSLCRTEGESLTEYTRPDAGVMNCELNPPIP